MKLILLCLLALATGCTTIAKHNPPPADFPALRVVEHHVDGLAVIRACYKYVPVWARLLGAIPEGCAEVWFAEGECHIYVRGDYPDARVLEHERLHCRGYDHPGGDEIRAAWVRYKAALLLSR